MRTAHLKTIVFSVDYATKKAGEEYTCDGPLARTIVELGVAEYKTADETNAAEPIDQEPVVPVIPDDAPPILDTEKPDAVIAENVPQEQAPDETAPSEVIEEQSEVASEDVPGETIVNETTAEFEPLPESAVENVSEEKVSAPVVKKPSKQQSSSKTSKKK
jgi:hypothetical protein